MKNTTLVILTVVLFAGTANAVVLTSSALDGNDVDYGGGGGIFSGASGAGVAVGTVTTTVVSNPGSGSSHSGTQTVKLRAVDAANGMDLTYDLNFTPFTIDTNDGNAIVDEQTRINGFATVNSTGGSQERENTALLPRGDGSTDIEFFRVTVDNVINSGATTFFLQGVTQLRFNALSGIEIQDFNDGGAVLASGGVVPAVLQDDDLTLSSPSVAFDIVATADDTTGPRRNFENRWEGVAVQFTDVPEPASLALLGIGGLMMIRRRKA